MSLRNKLSLLAITPFGMAALKKQIWAVIERVHFRHRSFVLQI
jgi:hypothetical protein